MKTLKDLDLKGKKILVRCDFNVPLDEKGNILDDYRIKKTIPTIKYLLSEGAKIILMSHLDNPKGKIIDGLRMDSIVSKLYGYLGEKVIKLDDCIGQEVKNTINRTDAVFLLENLRFHPEEENNDPEFAKKLSELGDFYINEAFSCSHRAHASIVGIPEHLPSFAGFLFEKEIEVFSNLLKNPQKPMVAIVGGKKVESKAGFINKISAISDWVLLGGLVDKEIKEKNIKLDYPQKIIFPVDDVDTFDIGSKTLEIFKEKISGAKTIFWAGPLGMTEKEKYSKGSEEIANFILKNGGYSVIGGGDTIEFINRLGLIEKFDYVSTGGGAMLSFLAGEKLPGIEVLR